MFEIPKDHQLTCLRCGWMPVGKRVLEHAICPKCQTDITLIFNNPEDYCRECQNKTLARNLGGLLGQEIFEVTDDRVGTMIWNVSTGYKIVDKASMTPLTPELTAKYLRVNITEPRHYDHVNPYQPGLIAEFRVMDGKEIQPVFVLIDGSHRAGRCLQASIPFCIYLLTHEQSERCRIL